MSKPFLETVPTAFFGYFNFVLKFVGLVVFLEITFKWLCCNGAAIDYNVAFGKWAYPFFIIRQAVLCTK